MPVIGITAPCSYVDIQWGFTKPLSCAAAPQSTTSACTVATTKLSAVRDVRRARRCPPPHRGTTQAIDDHAARMTPAYTGTAISNFLAGLMIYAPLTIKIGRRRDAVVDVVHLGRASPGSTFLL